MYLGQLVLVKPGGERLAPLGGGGVILEGYIENNIAILISILMIYRYYTNTDNMERLVCFLF